jgi:hypothetical protein
MSDNMVIYNAVRSVPKEAIKPIQAGRLKGKSDINPMWRLKTLTEQFGPCGIGWKYEITKQWIETGANGELSAFTNINLYIKYNGEWSEPIPGTGGSAFVANEKNGPYTSDECYKMALTDAISVACKALGVAADVYWKEDNTKYDKPQAEPQEKPQNGKSSTNDSNKSKNDKAAKYDTITTKQAAHLFAIAKGETKEEKAESVKMVISKYGYKATKEISTADYPQIVEDLESMPF